MNRKRELETNWGLPRRRSTDNIETVMRNTRGTIVCRRNLKTDQLSHWMGVVVLRAQEGFRQIHGHKEMGACAAPGRSKACKR